MIMDFALLWCGIICELGIYGDQFGVNDLACDVDVGLVCCMRCGFRVAVL